MPYILAAIRKRLDPFIAGLMQEHLSEGDLNYIITKLLHEWLIQGEMKYHRLNSVIGVLECAKLEMYRTVIVPYEKQKRAENGEVSHLEGGA